MLNLPCCAMFIINDTKQEITLSKIEINEKLRGRGYMSKMLDYIRQDMLLDTRYHNYTLECDPINSTSRHLVSKHLGFPYYSNFTNNEQVGKRTLGDALKHSNTMNGVRKYNG